MKRGIQFTRYIGDIGQRCDVQYIFLKLNISTSVAIPQFMKKIQKSLYGTVCFTVPIIDSPGTFLESLQDKYEELELDARYFCGNTDYKINSLKYITIKIILSSY
uniref:Uncharacterized protein n=1 Tax=Timema monikensis TaxID=170555 RepID=A0A7R9E3T1_9NEOP|nr:unnamed protein product [Timema monikensis]